MRQTRVTVASGSTAIFPIDYFGVNFAVGVYPSGGATATVTYTIDDPNDSTITAIYVALPAPLNVGVTANTVGQFSLTVARALKFATTVAGTCVYTVLQPSGDGGVI